MSEHAKSSPSPASMLQHIIEQQCNQQPAATAIFWRDEAISYQTLQKNISCCSSAIRSCSHAGDRIAVLALNCPEYIELMYAVPAANRILVPLNTRLSASALYQQIVQVGPTILIGDKNLIDKVVKAGREVVPPPLTDGQLSATPTHHYKQKPKPPEPPKNIHDKPSPLQFVISFGAEYDSWVKTPFAATHLTPAHQAETPGKPDADAESNNPAWLMFTSGTTGIPKAAILTHSSLLAALESANFGRPVHDGDRYLYPFPLFHVSAHNVLHQHQHGAAVALIPSFNAAKVLQCCQNLKITTLSLAPTMISLLLDDPLFDPIKLSSVRTIGYGASAISESLLKRVLNETSCGLSQGYGMTELSGSVAFLDAEGHRVAASCKPQLLKSVGKPVPSVDIQIVDESCRPVATGKSGEIIIRGTQVIPGYWRQPKATASAIKGGWLYTGDIGIFDKEGYLTIIDRKKDIIISGGENIASREVENILCQHPDVKQAAVVGLPDPKWGEIVCAMIECPSKLTPDALAIIDFCKQNLASYKTPKQLVFSTLPLNANNKVDKIKVREKISARLGQTFEK